MNYIELINHFWELDETWQFTCCETRLYFYLLKTANRLGWVDSWTHSDAKASANVGVSVNSFKNARNRLVQAELISFNNGGKGRGDKVRCTFRCQNLTPKRTPKQTPFLTPKQTLFLTPKADYTLLDEININQTNINPPTPLPDLHPAANENDFSDGNVFSRKSEKVEMPLKTEKEKEKSCAKKEKEDGGDFIDRIVNLFAQTHGSYEIVNRGKERAAAGKLLALYRKKHPDATTTETLEAIEHYFSRCMQIPDAWMRNNMSLPLIISKFNEINKHLKNGSNKHNSHGATADELASLFAKKLFGNQHL